jgi:glycosyltransferase involved in cell wall biosynthesis
MISVIIPSYKDPCLHKTIASILDNFEGDFEVIPVIDGYEPTPIIQAPRVKPVYLVRNVGMREAINKGVSNSSGEYIMRLDEHCMVGKGFDRIITEDIKDNWIVTARRYKLDPVKWEVMGEPIDYEKLIIKKSPRKFSGCQWLSREKDRKDILIDETMWMQGSCWVMSRKWWDKVIVRLDSNGYGPHYQDTTEMIFKTWKAGGKVMVNKKTWFAHKHRDFNRTHHYPTERAIPEWQFALDKWLPDYEEVRQKWGV